jgi:streptomycin 6-kinase
MNAKWSASAGIPIPSVLVAKRKTPERAAWLARLPKTIRELEERWSLVRQEPFDSDDVSCSWVAPVLRADGTHAVLKVGMPHMEGEHEVLGLRFWNGDGAVRVLESDEHLGAMLLERCEPGTALRAIPEPEQDVVIAELLRRLWRVPPNGHPFRPLAAMIAHWCAETRHAADHWPDAGLVSDGLQLLGELARNSADTGAVLLATDLHAGNVLRAQREPWLVIDPKPFVGDSAYDATQHLLNCRARMRTDPDGTMRRVANLLQAPFERVRLWMFARLAAEPRDVWTLESLDLARSVAPR